MDFIRGISVFIQGSSPGRHQCPWVITKNADDWIMNTSIEEAEVIRQCLAGNEEAIAKLFQPYRDRLKRLVRLRMDDRLTARVDASDVVQEAMIEALRRLASYAESPPGSFFLWLRTLTFQKLIDTHRHHLGAARRSAENEISIFRGQVPEASSMAIANHLLGRLTSPTRHVERAELQARVQEALNSLDPIDREVLVLRHFEYLTNDETAEALGLKKTTASKRYVTALRRLGDLLSSVHGFESGAL